MNRIIMDKIRTKTPNAPIVFDFFCLFALILIQKTFYEPIQTIGA